MTFACVKPSLTNSTPPSADFSSLCLSTTLIVTLSLFIDAHLLLVDLPEILSLTGSQGIEKITWDNSGERLVVSFKGGDDMYKGLIVIYDTRRTPLISRSLIGFIKGHGDNPKPISFSFHKKFKQGPLLFVSNGLCCTYPFLFRSHMLFHNKDFCEILLVVYDFEQVDFDANVFY
ncbi:hypothetical protein GYH30_024504 [Glycine max]|uniref:Uncharacterized protein n=2 Tax=Glycine subgen. Soja TaxID=1462606 RepID=K7LCQ8_SOYBN|nr:hypothetical protein GYH30_024504 [Glycine max]RZB91306.1 Aladin [Glycine soja]